MPKNIDFGRVKEGLVLKDVGVFKHLVVPEAATTKNIVKGELGDKAAYLGRRSLVLAFWGRAEKPDGLAGDFEGDVARRRGALIESDRGYDRDGGEYTPRCPTAAQVPCSVAPKWRNRGSPAHRARSFSAAFARRAACSL
jgi:hypothetical protein